MIFMSREIEKTGAKIFNIFPLRTEITPHHIKIDTKTLVDILLRKEHGTKREYLRGGNLKKNGDKIWEIFFKTELECFQKIFILFII